MDREKIEADIAERLGETWLQLSAEDRRIITDEWINEYIDPMLKQVESTLEKLETKKEGYGLMWLGVLFGLLGGLVATIVDRQFSSLGIGYEIIIVALFVGFLFYTQRFFNKKISKEVHTNKHLDWLRKYTKEE